MRFPKKTKGKWAERFAVGVLRAKGYRIVARNVLRGGGEIDIIARKNLMVVFVEVKYRRDRTALSAATHPRQWQRIAACATAYIGRHRFLQNHKWRFDEIWVSASIKPPSLFFRHHKNMWHYKH